MNFIFSSMIGIFLGGLLVGVFGLIMAFVNGGIKLPKSGGLKMDVLHHNSQYLFILFSLPLFYPFSNRLKTSVFGCR